MQAVRLIVVLAGALAAIAIVAAPGSAATKRQHHPRRHHRVSCRRKGRARRSTRCSSCPSYNTKRARSHGKHKHHRRHHRHTTGNRCTSSTSPPNSKAPTSPTQSGTTTVVPPLSPTWTAPFDGSWGLGTSNSFSPGNGFWGFDGNPSGFIGGYSWSYTNQHFSFASSPVYQGSTRSFDATVDGSAGTSGEAGQRTGLYLSPADPSTEPIRVNESAAYEGQDQWYHFHVYFPAGFSPEPNTSWNWFDVFHNFPNTLCCGNISMGVVTDNEDGGAVNPGGRISVRVMGGGSPSNPIPNGTDMGAAGAAAQYGGQMRWYRGPNLQLGHWYDILIHVVWAWEPSVGEVQLYLDGSPLVSYGGPTLYYYQHDGSASGSPAGPGNDYLWAGYYRGGTRNGATDTQSDSVYHDDYMRGPSSASVGN